MREGPITVGELVDRLRKLHPDLPVYRADECHGDQLVDPIEVTVEEPYMDSPDELEHLPRRLRIGD